MFHGFAGARATLENEENAKYFVEVYERLGDCRSSMKFGSYSVTDSSCSLQVCGIDAEASRSETATMSNLCISCILLAVIPLLPSCFAGGAPISTTLDFYPTVPPKSTYRGPKIGMCI